MCQKMNLLCDVISGRPLSLHKIPIKSYVSKIQYVFQNLRSTFLQLLDFFREFQSSI